MEKLIVTVRGNCTGNNAHKTTIKRGDGQEKEFYCDGWEGISFQDVIGILEFLGIECFEVHRE